MSISGTFLGVRVRLIEGVRLIQVSLYNYRRPAGGGGGGQIGKAVAFGRSDLTVSHLYRQSLFSRFNGTKSKAWLFSETEIVNSKHVNSEYAIYYW